MIIDSDQPIGNQGEIATLVSALDATKYMQWSTMGWYAYGPRASRHEASRAAILNGSATDWDQCYGSKKTFQKEVSSGFGGQLIKIHVLLRQLEFSEFITKLLSSLNQTDPNQLPFATFKVVRDANATSAKRLPELVESEGKDGIVAAVFNTVSVPDVVATIDFLRQVTPQGTNLDNNVTDMLTRTLLYPRLTIGQFDGTVKTAFRWRYPSEYYGLFPVLLGGGVTRELANTLESQGLHIIKGEEKYLACKKEHDRIIS